MGVLFRNFCILLTATCALTSAKDKIFGSNKEFIYSFNADIKVGTEDPESYASQYGLKSWLNIQSNEDGSAAIFQLSNISMEAYNGLLTRDGDAEGKFIPISDKSLEEPFEVIYSDGLVKSIIINEKEETMWSKNMKKSIAGIFQLDMNKLKFDKYNAFTTEEKTIYGICPTEYSILANGENNSVLRKSPSHSGCKDADSYRFWSNVDEVACNNKGKHTIHMGTERLFEILPAEKNHSINQVITTGYFSLSPYAVDGFSKYIYVKQTFDLEGENPGGKYESISGVKANDLKFTVMDLNENSDTYFSSTGDRKRPSKETLIELVKEQLNHLVDLLEEIKVGGPNDQGGFLEQKDNEKSRMLTFEMMKTLKYLDYEDLKNIFSTVAVGTSYMEETSRALFLELLSQTGTKASITFLKDLIIDKTIKLETAIEILKTIPFNVRHPNEALLKIYEDVLTIKGNDRLKRAATLSFATMVYKTCKGEKCSPEVLDKYILKYLELFKESTDYEWQMTYMEGLSNIQIGNVFKYLEPIITGDEQYSRHIRFLAMWASHQSAIQDPDRVFEVYWPILENIGEHLELRIGAFTVLLLSKPQPQRFHSLAQLMNEELEGSHLYYFYYTTLQSLAGTTHPCYQEMKQTVQHILRYAKIPDRELPYTGNNLFDYIDTDYTFGYFLQSFMVADEKTAAPYIIYLTENEYFLGRNKQLMGLYLKVHGLPELIRDKYVLDKEGSKLTKLQELLSEHGVRDSDEDSESLHIEVIVQFQDKATTTYYFNQTTFLQWPEALSMVPDAAQNNNLRINYQRLFFPLVQEFIAPTDLGVPMSLNVQIPLLFSFRANFTVNDVDAELINKLLVDMKYWRKGDIVLSVYNPIGKMWHGISRSHSTLVHLPLNAHISTDKVHKSLKFSLHKNQDMVPGLALHGGSHIFTVPVLSNKNGAQNLLHESCPSCLSYIPVNGENHEEKMEYENEEIGRLGINYVFRYFDCDVQEMPFILENALDETLMNYNDRFTDGLGLFLIQFYNKLMHLPIFGRCGFVAKITPENGTDVSNWIGILNYTSEDINSNERKIRSRTSDIDDFVVSGSLSRENQEGHVVKLYDFSLIKNSSGPLNHQLKFKFIANDPSNEKLQMCLDAEVNFPEPPVDPLKQRDPEEEVVTGFIDAVIGLAPIDKCPKIGAVLKIAGRAQPVPDMSIKSYATCSEEAQSPEWASKNSSLMPSTLACREAAFDSTELRRFEFSIEASDYITKLISKSIYAFYMESGTDPWGKFIISSTYSVDEYPVVKDGSGYVLEFSPNGFLLVDTLDEEERERVVFALDDFHLLSSRFSLFDSVAHDETMDGICVITASTVLTLDGRNITYEGKPCYVIALGHCYFPYPKFAVLVQKIEGTQNLALKFYGSEKIVEMITESDNSIKVYVDEELIDFNKENGYQVRDQFDTIRFWQRPSTEKNGTLYIQLYSTSSEISLDYTGDRVIINFSPLFTTHLCGLCGIYKKPPLHTEWDVCPGK